MAINEWYGNSKKIWMGCVMNMGPGWFKFILSSGMNILNSTFLAIQRLHCSRHERLGLLPLCAVGIVLATRNMSIWSSRGRNVDRDGCTLIPAAAVDIELSMDVLVGIR